MSAVDLTKCQPGDLLKMRCGEIGVYVRRHGRDQHTVCGEACEVRVSNAGMVFWKTEYAYDVVSIVHPTRAELEGQRRELLAVAKLAQRFVDGSCGDVSFAELSLACDSAIARAEATHG